MVKKKGKKHIRRNCNETGTNLSMKKENLKILRDLN